jgi:hypothetical protein
MRSYWKSDAWWFSDSEGSGQPQRVRTLLVYSGAGRVQVAMGRDIIYGPQLSRLPHGFTYRAESGPANPALTAVTAGWVKTMAGFGVINDWEADPPASAIKAWVAVSGNLVIKESFRSVFVPHWFLILVFALMPGRRIYRWAKVRRRKKSGLCARCGYDMRGGGERCPECGVLR